VWEEEDVFSESAEVRPVCGGVVERGGDGAEEEFL